MFASVIIVADDFGHSAAANAAIVRSFGAGLITHASLMTNMGISSVDAMQLIDENGLHGRIGIHLNASQGAPLTHGIRSTPVFCNPDGTFRCPPKRTWRLPKDALHKIWGEWNEQIRRCVDAGIRPTHIDSHHHQHTQWPLTTVAMRLAEEWNISRLRLSRNIDRNGTFVKTVYKRVLNERIRRAGLAQVKWFGPASGGWYSQEDLDGVAELMVHPRLDHLGRVVDYPTCKELSDVVAPYIQYCRSPL